MSNKKNSQQLRDEVILKLSECQELCNSVKMWPEFKGEPVHLCKEAAAGCKASIALVEIDSNFMIKLLTYTKDMLYALVDTLLKYDETHIQKTRNQRAILSPCIKAIVELIRMRKKADYAHKMSLERRLTEEQLLKKREMEKRMAEHRKLEENTKKAWAEYHAINGTGDEQWERVMKQHEINKLKKDPEQERKELEALIEQERDRISDV